MSIDLSQCYNFPRMEISGCLLQRPSTLLPQWSRMQWRYKKMWQENGVTAVEWKTGCRRIDHRGFNHFLLLQFLLSSGLSFLFAFHSIAFSTKPGWRYRLLLYCLLKTAIFLSVGLPKVYNGFKAKENKSIHSLTAGCWSWLQFSTAITGVKAEWLWLWLCLLAWAAMLEYGQIQLSTHSHSWSQSWVTLAMAVSFSSHVGVWADTVICS